MQIMNVEGAFLHDSGYAGVLSSRLYATATPLQGHRSQKRSWAPQRDEGVGK